MKTKTLIIGILFLLNISCKTNQTSMIVADKYDATNNQTTLTILPYGNIIIPNEWKKTSYNQVSKQHFFQNSDLTTISIAKNLKEKYPFYKTEQNDKEFVAEFVKWDSEYWKQQGLEILTIENKAENAEKETVGGIKMEKILRIEGMMCAHCQKHVQETLAGLDGVTKVEVSLEDKTATVQMNRNIPFNEFEKAVQDAGYELLK